MIIVSGIVADAMTELICARLHSSNEPYVLLDGLRVPSGSSITWELSNGRFSGRMRCADHDIDLNDVSGVYTREVNYCLPHEEMISDEGKAIHIENRSTINALWDVIPALVINRPSASVSNSSKLYQQLILRSIGFNTPETIVTTDPDEVIKFYRKHDGRVIYKSCSSIRSIVHMLTEADFKRLECVRCCPTQFQEHIPGIDVRVHTVGSDLFAAEIRSDAPDYRYASHFQSDVTVRATKVGDDVAERCLLASRRLGLAVAGIDLRYTAEGKCYCFEVNTSPAFLYYERQTQQPISVAVASLLARGCSNRT